MSAFVKSCIFHRPDLFRGPDNLALLFGYLDDFLGGAETYTGSRLQAREHAAKQMAFVKEVGRWLGLSFLKTKMCIPDSQQSLLGITLDVLQRQCSLKPGKAEKITELTDSLLHALFWDSKNIEKLMGNTV